MGKIKDETLRLDIVVNGNKGQKAILELDSANRKLKNTNDDLRKAKQLLIKEGKKNTDEYKKLTEQIKVNNKELSINKSKIADTKKEIGLSALSSKQLRLEQRKLKSQLANTVKSLQPEAYAKYEKQLAEVNTELAKLRTNGKQTGGILSTMKTQFGGVAGLLAGAFSIGAVIQFGNKIADSVAELRKTKSVLKQITGLKGLALTKASSSVKALADTYEKSTKEMTIAVHNFAEGMEIDFDTALELTKQGFLDGADANEEFLDKLREYPGLLKEAGFSADEAVALMTQEVKTGIYSDKGVDAIKEANLRLREMTPATKEALDAIGISSNTVQQELTNGSKTTFDIMQKVSAKLAELPPQSAEVGTAIADIFGGPGEDAGLKYLANLQNIDLTTGSLTTTTNEYLEAQKKEIEANEAMNLVWLKLTGTGSAISTLYSNLRLAVAELLGGQQSLTQTFEDQASNVINLNNTLIPLTDEYDDLKSKSELSKDEQIRLKKVIGEIAEIAPTAITAFDEYGNALDISSDKARNFIETQKALLSFNNKEAIEENTDALKGYQNQIKLLQGELNKRNSEGDLIKIKRYFDAESKITEEFEIKLTAKEIQLKQAKLAELQKLESGALESIDQLSGDYLNKFLEKQKNQTKLTLEEAKKRADVLGIPYSEESTSAQINALILQQQQINAKTEAERLKSIALQEQLQKANQTKLTQLEEKYENEKLQRLAINNKAKAQLARDAAIKEAKALGAKKELLEAIENEHKIKIDEAKDKDEEIELQRVADFEARKTALLNEIELSKKETELEKEILKAEQDAKKQELKILQLKLSKEEETELLKLLETQEQIALEAIRKKYRLKKEKADEVSTKKTIISRKNLNKQIIDSSINLVGQETRLGKALIAFKGLMAAKETLISLGVLKSKVATNAAGATADIAAGTAKTAKVGFPQNIPLLIGFAAQVAGIISAITSAGKVATKTTGFETGLYPIQRTDGKIFNSKLSDNSNTQLVTQPTYFSDGDYLAGEGGPEIIIDTPTLKQLDPSVIQQIYATAARTRGFETGYYPSNETATPSASAENETSSFDFNLLTNAVYTLIAKLDEPLIATTLIGDNEVDKIKTRQNKLYQTRQNAKVN